MLIVVRHGRTATNAEGRLLGRADPPLDDVGRAQAAAIARTIGSVDRVVSSPLQRARETAAAFDVEVEVDDRWIELDYGELEGVPLGDVPASTWATWRADLSFVPAGGESLAAMGERVRRACADVADAAAAGDVVVVTHVSPLKAAVAWALGVNDSVAWRMFVAPGSITRIRTSGPLPALVTFDEQPHSDLPGPSGILR